MRYCFSPVVQKQLTDLVIEWNHHRVWKSGAAEAPGGIPEVLYFSPESSGTCTVLHMNDTGFFLFYTSLNWIMCMYSILYAGCVDNKHPVERDLVTHAIEEYGYAGGLVVNEDVCQCCM